LNLFVDLTQVGEYQVQIAFDFEAISTPLNSNVCRFKIAERESRRPQIITADVQASNQTAGRLGSVTEKVIVLGLGANEFSLGSSPMQVEYKNLSEKEWSIVRPDIAQETRVMVQVVGKFGKEEELYPNAIFDEVMREGNMRRIHLVPQQPKIVMGVNQSRKIPLDLYVLNFNWQPGEYQLWILNVAENLSSNRITFKLRATADTIGLLLDMAEKESDSKDVLEHHHQEMRQNFAINWLIKTFADLPLNPITDRDDQNVVNAKYEQNRRFIADFREKWKTRKDSPEIKELFQRLNAGK